METINQITNIFIGLIGIGLIFRIIQSSIAILTNDESKKTMYIERIKNGLVAFVIVINIFGIKELVEYYFS